MPDRLIRIGTIFVLAFILSGIVFSQEKDAEWITNFETAKKVSEEKNIPILANFSGSDWWGWCKKLDQEVFSQKAFKDFAKDNLVLFYADFPRSKQLPLELKDQNNILVSKYNIRGFPTVLLLDSKGNVLATTGYQRGGAEQYIFHIKTLISSAQNN